jgi:hypothetical protein
MATNANASKGSTTATNTNTNAKGKGKGSPYAVAALPTNSVQYRHASGGTGTVQATNYAQAIRLLYGWAGGPAAKGTPNYQHVAALVHLSWCAGNGARATVRKANSAACTNSGNVLQFGQPAAPQVCSVLQWLATAGAPKPVLATVWATYTGKA